MDDYVITCCSTVDLTREQLLSSNLPCQSFRYIVNGQEQEDDLLHRRSMHDFYEDMRNGAQVHTAQLNPEDYRLFFEPFLEQGLDILHVTLSGGMSGTVNSALIAAAELCEQYPERSIRILDSLGASSGTGLLVKTLADRKADGQSLEEVFRWAEENKRRMHYWFYSSDLTYYVKGGRITKAAGWFGTVLKICPVLNVDFTGKIVPRFKVRGKKNAGHELLRQMKLHAENGENYTRRCYICHSDCAEDAEALAHDIRKSFPHLQEDIGIFEIGPTVGCHSGPGTVALFFWGDERTD